jgi:spermidine/putrescine transport system substrate-binding protein
MSIALSRRRLLRGAGGAAFLGASAAALPLFGTPSGRQTPASCASVDLSARDATLTVSNWPLYIDPLDHPESTLRRFERDTGITVRYHDDVVTNQEFFVKIANQLGSCQPSGRDLVVMSGREVTRMIELGWLQELDHACLPRVKANLLPHLWQANYDPGRRFSVPWQSGFTGIGYNAKLVPEVRSYRELLTREDLRGRVTLMNDMLDTMSAMLTVAGADPRQFNEDEWQAALEVLVQARRRGQIRAMTSNEFVNQLLAGDIAASIGWSTSVIEIQLQYPHIRFVVPEEGMYLWTDNMMVPNRADHKAHAERWIDYYYEPEIAARLCATVTGLCPVAGAREAMERLDPRKAANPFLFPPDELFASAFEIMPLEPATMRRYLRDLADAAGS